MKWISALLLSLLVCSVAHADDYINTVGVRFANIDQGERFSGAGITDSVTTTDLIVEMSGRINKFTSVNIRAGVSAQSEEISVGADTLEIEHDYFFGAYFRVQYPLGWLTPYAQAGQTRISETLSLSGDSESQSFSDSSYAGGMEMEMGDRWLISAEYFLLSEKNGVKRGGPSAGISYRF